MYLNLKYFLNTDSLIVHPIFETWSDLGRNFEILWSFRSHLFKKFFTFIHFNFNAVFPDANPILDQVGLI